MEGNMGEVRLRGNWGWMQRVGIAAAGFWGSRV